MAIRVTIKSTDSHDRAFEIHVAGRVLTISPSRELISANGKLFPGTRTWAWLDGSQWELDRRLRAGTCELRRDGKLIAEAKRPTWGRMGPPVIHWQGHVPELPARFIEQHHLCNQWLRWKLENGASVAVARLYQSNFWPKAATREVVCSTAWPWLPPMAVGALTYLMSESNG